MKILQKVVKVFCALNDFTVRYFAFFLIFPLITVIVMDVVCRYFLEVPLTWSYDLSWMLSAAFVFLGGGYVLRQGGHVKADVFFAKFSPFVQNMINIFCYLVFFFPSMIGLTYITGKNAYNSWIHGETSPFTAWAPIVGPIKSLLFLSALLLVLQGCVEFGKCVGNLIRKGENHDS